MARVKVSSSEGIKQEIQAGPHRFFADEPPSAGGSGEGPSPYQLLLAAIGSCTAITMRLYANHKGWPLADVRVELEQKVIDASECDECQTTHGKLDSIEKRIYVVGDLAADQVDRLLAVARRCPVSLTLQREVRFVESITLESADAEEA